MPSIYADSLLKAAERVLSRKRELKSLVSCSSDSLVNTLATEHKPACNTEVESGETVDDTILKSSETTPDSVSLVGLGIKATYIASINEVSHALSHLLEAKTLLGLDIETYGLPEFVEDKQAGLEPRKSAIRLVQLYDGDKTIYVFDIKKLGGMASLGEAIWDKPMVAHNALFELSHLLHKGVHPKRLGCTLLVDRVLNGNRIELRDDLRLSKHAGLKDLAKELLGLDVSKELQVSDWSTEELSKEQIEYAALDSLLVAKLFSLQYQRLVSSNLMRSYRLLRDAQLAIVRMQLTGIGFDVIGHQQQIVSWTEEKALLEQVIGEAIGQQLNLNSGKQVGQWLNEALGQEALEAWLKTAKGSLSTSTPTFKLNKSLHAIFPKIVAYRGVAKLISSFGKTLYKFIDISSNRLYGSFSLGTTATGRMASRNPNLQNMPRKDFRKFFVAKEGYVLIGLDYSQQELRVAALVAQDKELLGVYERGEDAHINTAAMLLKIPKEKIGKKDRQLAKAVNFGLLYGQGAKSLTAYAKQNYGVDLTEEEAKTYRAGFFRVYKGLRQWQIDTGRMVEITQKISTPCGRVRDFSRERDGYRYTAALNLPIQGAAAEITLYALVRLTPFLCEECSLVNVIHDEILLEVKEDMAEEFSKNVIAVMEQAFLDVFPNAGPYMRGLVEAKSGKNWEETK